jgi:ABC-type lipoprotein release transport system permease subunit
MLTVLSANFGVGVVDISLNFVYVILLIPAMVLVSVAGSFIPGLRAATLTIVDVLRRE